MYSYNRCILILLLTTCAYFLYQKYKSTVTRFTHDSLFIIQNDRADTLEVFEKCACENFNYLIGALYVYKGLLVVFGLFLAYESRNVKYYFINDSRFTSIAIYIVVIVVGIGAPLSLVLSEHLFIDPAYSLTVVMIVTATMSCLLIIFIPKVIQVVCGILWVLQESVKLHA